MFYGSIQIEGTNNYKSDDDSYIMKKQRYTVFNNIRPRRWRSGLERSGVRIPAATDLSRNNSSTVKRSVIGVSVTGPRSEMTIIGIGK